MNGFNPAAATAAYLQMIDPAREARAIAYTHGAHWIELWSWMIALGVDLLLLHMGLIARVRDRVERVRPRPNLVAFSCVALFAAGAGLIRLPWAIYSDWGREHAYGLSDTAFGAWLVQSLTSLVLTALVLGLFAIPVYALMRRSGRRWWLWSGGIVALFALLAIVVAPAVVDPLFGGARSAPAGPVRQVAAELARRAHIPADRIVVQDSTRFTATVVGGPGFATIKLGSGMFTPPLDLAAVRAVTAHEIGHYVHHHLLLLALVVSVILVCCLGITDAVFRRRGWSIADPANAPRIHIILASLMLLTGPLIVSVQRGVESDADRFGLALADEPDGAARALLRTVDFRASAPGELEELLFYDHPSIAHRVRAAMDWKAAHGGGAGK